MHHYPQRASLVCLLKYLSFLEESGSQSKAKVLSVTAVYKEQLDHLYQGHSNVPTLGLSNSASGNVS